MSIFGNASGKSACITTSGTFPSSAGRMQPMTQAPASRRLRCRCIAVAWAGLPLHPLYRRLVTPQVGPSAGGSMLTLASLGSLLTAAPSASSSANLLASGER